MREIIFRGKSVKTGGWVFGSLITYPDGTCFICTPSDDPDILDKWWVALETVGQFTGLMDKSGSRIFEGDIIQTSKYGKDDGNGRNFSGKDRFEVSFECGSYCLRNKMRRFNLRPDAEIEVIGNIYESEDWNRNE